MAVPVLKPVQIAYHVPDPVLAAHQSAAHFGWGPFFLMEHISLAECRYRGQPATFDHTSAYGQAGSLMIEFITQHDDEPSPVRDLYSAQERGLHHVAHFVPDLAAALTEFGRRGYVAALEARTAGGVAFAMIDTSRELGHMVELYEPVRGLQRFYDYVRNAAQEWDGADPVRRLEA